MLLSWRVNRVPVSQPRLKFLLQPCEARTVHSSNNNDHDISSASTDVDLSTLRKVIAASAIGNFVEWFDFAVYGFLAVVISQHFFPDRC